MKQILALLALIILFVCDLQAQNKPRRRLSYSELFTEIQKHPDSTYLLENAEIYYNHQTDSLRFGTWVIARSYQNYNPFGFKEKNENGRKSFEGLYYYDNKLDAYWSDSDLKFATYNWKNEKLHRYLDSLLPVLTIDKHLRFKNVVWEGMWSNSAIRRIKFKKSLRFDKTINDEKVFKSYAEFFTSRNFKILVPVTFSFIPFFEKCEFNRIEIYFYSGENIEKEIDYEREEMFFLLCRINYLIISAKGNLGISKVSFSNCDIQSAIFVDLKTPLFIQNSEIKYMFVQNLRELYLKNITFSNKSKPPKISDFLYGNRWGFSIVSGNYQKIQIDSCTFEKIPEEWKKENPKFWNEAGIQDVTCEKLSITNCTFNSHFYLIGSKITEEIFLENNRFNNDFSLGSGSAKSGYERNIINFETAFMPYNQFKKGLSTEIRRGKTTVYYGNTDEELANNTEFEHLLLYYNKFYKMYKDQNDRVSANACFIDLKRLETRHIRYRYHQTGNLDLWLEWKFYEFLDYVSEYGTNPFLALKRSLLFILIFAGILMLLPSVKDYLMPSVFRKALQSWGLALQKEGGFTEIKSAEIQKKLDDLEAFRKSMEITEGNVPSVLVFFLKPLLVTAKIYYYLQRLFLSKIDFTQGNWHELSHKQKLWVSTRIFFAILSLIVWGVIMRIINSMALSMNCFVTLGYGEIKAKGIARYVVVIEGVIGWIMLTVFSASLIAQLMG